MIMKKSKNQYSWKRKQKSVRDFSDTFFKLFPQESDLILDDKTG